MENNKRNQSTSVKWNICYVIIMISVFYAVLKTHQSPDIGTKINSSVIEHKEFKSTTKRGHSITTLTTFCPILTPTHLCLHSLTFELPPTPSHWFKMRFLSWLISAMKGHSEI